jgi:hypothetical protein
MFMLVLRIWEHCQCCILLGIPEESDQGSILFLIYINVVPERPDCKFSFSTNDLALWTEPWLVRRKLRPHSSFPEHWFTKWNLCINLHKTVAKIFIVVNMGFCLNWGHWKLLWKEQISRTANKVHQQPLSTFPAFTWTSHSDQAVHDFSDWPSVVIAKAGCRRMKFDSFLQMRCLCLGGKRPTTTNIDA